MSASAWPSSKVPLPTIMIEPPKLVITVSDPDSGRRVSHKISLAFCDAIPCVLTGTSIVALEPDCNPETPGKMGILLAKAPTKSKDLRATMTVGNYGEDKYAVASQLWLLFADACSPSQLQEILRVMGLQGAILHNITPRWQIIPNPMRQGFHGLLVAGKSMKPTDQESSQITMKIPGKVRVVDLYNEVKLSLVVRGHENVANFRGIFYMDALECKTVAELLSPTMACNIATYHSEIALVFNSFEGVSLHAWTRSEHGLSEACALHALKGIGEALRYIHQLHVVHSNVNPESIFIKTDGESVLADFSCAANMADGVQPVGLGQLVPAQYSSPEQVGDSKGYGPPTDVFALGGCLYFALSDVQPFKGKCREELVWSILHRSPDLGRTEFKYVSAKTRDFIRMLMYREPGLRPTAAEACQVLRNPEHSFFSDAVSELMDVRQPPITGVSTLLQRVGRYTRKRVMAVRRTCQDLAKRSRVRLPRSSTKSVVPFDDLGAVVPDAKATTATTK